MVIICVISLLLLCTSTLVDLGLLEHLFRYPLPVTRFNDDGEDDPAGNLCSIFCVASTAPADTR